MKINIQNGVMAIIGQTRGSIVCEVRGVDTFGYYTHGHIMKFASNCIETDLPGTGTSLIIFEYNLRGELKNPRKLLKSLRSKVMKILLNNQMAMEQDSCDLEWAMDMAATHGRGPAYNGSYRG